jgi:hypothetical protein
MEHKGTFLSNRLGSHVNKKEVFFCKQIKDFQNKGNKTGRNQNFVINFESEIILYME